MSAAEAARRLALQGAFAQRKGRFSLPVSVQVKLVEFFMDETSRSVAELPLDTSSFQDDSWKDEWAEYAKDAGLTLSSDVGSIMRWVSAKPGSGAGATRRCDVALTVLQDHGIDVPPALQ